ncbi:MAG TPA: hypothetical protein VG146_00170, partial [Verrucomicrobiae bacterium]|nr:hypothetical protein [Verrucomicrobiae bacterium]
GNISPRFVSGKAAKRFARKFKRTIHLVDSTTIQLIASCIDWAKHRRSKAAAKCHLRLDLQSFLPRFAIIDTAREADAKRARGVVRRCAALEADCCEPSDYPSFAGLLAAGPAPFPAVAWGLNDIWHT